mgnify:FL=1
MRLSKRIAAVALAAVMAVSMLTACGGGGGGSTGGSNSGNGGSNNGNNSSNVGGNNTGKGSNTGSNTGNGGDSGNGGSGAGSDSGTTVTEIPFTKSKIYKTETLKEYYVITIDSDGDQNLVAVKGENVYSKYEYTYENNTITNEELLKGKDRYTIVRPGTYSYESLKEAIEYMGYDTAKMTKTICGHTVINSGTSENPGETVTMPKVQVGTRELDKKTYYAETIVYTKNNSETWCFDESGKPKAMISTSVNEDGKKEEYITRVKTFEYHVSDTSVFDLPNDAVIVEYKNNMTDADALKQLEEKGLISKK